MKRTLRKKPNNFVLNGGHKKIRNGFPLPDFFRLKTARERAAKGLLLL